MDYEKYWHFAGVAYRALPHSKSGYIVEYFDRKTMMWTQTNIICMSVAECKLETEFIFGLDVPCNDIEVHVVYE